MTVANSKYQWAINMVQDMIPRFGNTVTIESPVYTVIGQDEEITYDTYQAQAVITENLRGRGNNYHGVARSRMLLPRGSRIPKVGDVVTDISGKKYIVEMTTTSKPDGYDIVYEVFLADG